MELIVRRAGQQSRVRIVRREDSFEIGLDGEASYRLERSPVDSTVRSLIVDGRQYEVSVHPLGRGHYRVTTAWGDEEVEVVDALTHLARQSHETAAGPSRRRVEAYMPGKVVAVLVAEGDEVDPGQGLVVLEAMKMENEIQAEVAGVVRRIFVAPGEAVEGGDPLFEIE